MSELHLYTFVDEDGQESTYCTERPLDAKEYARTYSMLCYDNTFIWDDREPAWDFRPKKEQGGDE